jgi:hypothetical protein
LAFDAACISSGINSANAATLFMTAERTAAKPAMIPMCAPSGRDAFSR